MEKSTSAPHAGEFLGTRVENLQGGSMSQWKVAFAQPEDQACCEYIDHLMGFATAETLHRRAIAEGRVLVARYDNHDVAGYLRYGFLWDETLPIIQMIRVIPEGRRRGGGRVLVLTLEQHLRQQQLQMLLSSTDDTNRNSLLFHRALGFQECGRLTIMQDGTQEIFLKKLL